MSLQVKLSRESLVYYSGETIQGQVTVLNQANTAHAGLKVTVKGVLHLMPGKKELGKVEQTFTLLRKSKQLLEAGKIVGNTEIDFSLQLIPESGSELYETYHGQNVAVEYMVVAELQRTGLKKPLWTTVDFILERPAIMEGKSNAVKTFEIGDIGGDLSSKIVGHVQTTSVDIRTPIEGELEVVSAPPLEGIELQVVRKEKIKIPELVSETTSEAQCCELVVGDVQRNLSVPIYCMLQKFVVCPSLETSKFDLSFLLRLKIVYKDGTAGTREHYHDIPIELQRLERA
ncbi:vacuolar protein sorting-associated protein [Chloropicon primus]|uniref:Vacuolar protein sorting-associated protein n=1 Tax=Chloropicon primus TaxID=1764295 RepID=A0A5B8MDD0_9CHLO|nr:vacuolar protein sorting-associated protein [Chloropicon primus]UPQ97807.1 vacuolar protein sorting-associated protein [Chloropicon primus]|eukprot:QDZ18598.1 vacuolar protein sorting-associated protein [Chloropicon primus]